MYEFMLSTKSLPITQHACSLHHGGLLLQYSMHEHTPCKHAAPRMQFNLEYEPPLLTSHQLKGNPSSAALRLKRHIGRSPLPPKKITHQAPKTMHVHTHTHTRARTHRHTHSIMDLHSCLMSWCTLPCICLHTCLNYGIAHGMLM